jgi:hypothetical protein
MTSRTVTSFRRPTLPQIAGAVLALVVAAGSCLLSLSIVTARADPRLATRLWPANSIAQADLAAMLFAEDPSVRGAAKAAGPASRALAGQPDNVVAARTMAGIEAARNHGGVSLQWLTYAQSLSRRDLVTQLMLIETKVSTGDVAGALLHYDRAMRVSQSSWPTLFPILFSAAGDPAVRPQLIAMLRQRPGWFVPFMSQFTAGATPFATVFPVVRALRLDPANAQDSELLAHAIHKGADAGNFVQARALLPQGNSKAVRNGGFETSGGYPPFDWVLQDDGELSATIQIADDPARGNVLALTAQNGRSGEVARQLLLLAPGRHAINLRSGALSSDANARPEVRITCAASKQEALRWRLPGSGVVRQVFTISPECDAQWLAISITAASDGSTSQPWIDDLRVMPVPGER